MSNEGLFGFCSVGRVAQEKVETTKQISLEREYSKAVSINDAAKAQQASEVKE